MMTEKNKKQVLVIEDDVPSAELLKAILEDEGFEVKNTYSGVKGIKALNAGRYDVLLLDLNLPDMDGNDILKYLYKNSRFSQLTIIVVSGRSEEIDVVLGFEFGADDYIHKPIRKRELIARINANINRKNINIADSTETIKFGDSQFDSRKKQLKKNGKTIKLTPKEYYLLQFFLSNPNRISSRKEILGSVWDASAAFETRTVDMHVKMLRRKIGDDNGDIIETVRGMGYRFNMEAV